MNEARMTELVDKICEEEGFEDSPAYDYLFEKCCMRRSDEDAEIKIREMLADYNKRETV